MRRSIRFLLVAAACGSGCHSGNTTNVPSPHLIVVPSTAGGDIVVTPSQLTIPLATNAWAKKVTDASVLMCGVNCNTGHGFLRKISSLNDDGQNLTLQTTYGALTDAYQKASFQLNVDLSQTPPNALTNGADVDTSFDISSGPDFGAKLTHIGIQMAPKIDIGAQIDLFSLNEFHVIASDTLTADVTAELDMGLTKSATGSVDDLRTTTKNGKEVTLLDFEFGPFPIPGLPPAVFFVHVHFIPGFDLTYDEKLSLIEQATATASFTLGARYQNGAWSPVSSDSLQFTFMPPTVAGEAQASADAYVKAQVEIWLLDMGGPYVGVRPYVGAQAGLEYDCTKNPPADIGASLYYGVAAYFGGQVGFMGDTLASYDFDFFDARTPFAQKTLPLTGIPSICPSPDAGADAGGGDGGLDAGTDAGLDAGPSPDSGGPDAGAPPPNVRDCTVGPADGGADAGPIACDAGSQCPSQVCGAGQCKAPTCANGVMNGQETGTDCGGCGCLPCGAGKGCAFDTDCLSGACVNGTCAMPAGTAGLRWLAQLGPGFNPSYGEAAAVDSAGNSVFVGELGEPASIAATTLATGVFAIKLSPGGAPLWSRSLVLIDAGFPPILSAQAVAVGSGGDVFMTGDFSASVDFGMGPVQSPPTSADSLYVLRLSGADGSTVWVKTFPMHRSGLQQTLALDGAGNVWVAGPLGSGADLGMGPIDGGFFVAEYEPSAGAAVWTSAFAITQNAIAYKLAGTPSGVWVGGQLYGADVDLGGGLLPYRGLHDIFLMQLGAGGAFQSARSFGSPCYDELGAIAVDGAGNLLVAAYGNCPIDFGGGPFGRQSMYDDVFLVKLSPGGGYQWARQFGGPQTDSAFSLAADPSGDLCVGGQTGAGGIDFGTGALARGAFLAKLLSNGDTVWATNGMDQSAGGVANVQSLAFAPGAAPVATGWFTDHPSGLASGLDAGAQPAVFMMELSP